MADQVIVVDDDSADGTSRIAASLGASVIKAPPLPEGWTGKAWACWTGAAAARCNTLVFLDADVTLAPDALDRITREQRAGGGLYSVQPYADTELPYERLSAFFNIVGMMGVDAFNPRPRPRSAFGPCMVCSKQDYETVGGHEAVKGEVLEDVALARRFRDARLPVTCKAGREVVHFRMYPGGIGQLVEGWSKNFAGGASSVRPLTLLLIFVWLTGCLTGVLNPVFYAAYAGQLYWMLRRVGRFGIVTAVLYPVPLLFFLAVFCRSGFLTLVRGEVRWRGRTIRTR
jgi:4,4'-diaponeurosporenoate glycosyltransferase